MVPKVAGKGQSFKGAGLYYLHDKKADTAERVAFTHTENVPTDDPELALRYMAYTAMRQAELKAAAGVAMTGRKLVQTVYAYSLSWAPDEDPSQEQMIEAALATLKALGLDGHETLLVAHNDEPHPHIHVIVNRVNPENGLAAKLSNDHLVLSRWAEAYEREHGKIRCEERVENNRRRREGQFVKDRRSLDKAAHHRARKQRVKAAFERRAAESKNLSAHHKGQRQFLYDEKERRVRSRRQEIRDANRPKWAALFRQQFIERKELERQTRTVFPRLRYFIRHRSRGERGFLAGAVSAIFGRARLQTDVAAQHEKERKALAAEVTQQTRGAIAQENTYYRAELNTLKALQGQDTAVLREAQAKESQQLAREIKEEADREKFEVEIEKDGPPKVSEEFRKRAAEAIKKQKKRDDRSKGQGRERE
jgi:hypothetical protein